MFIAQLDHPDFARLRPDLAAHRDHGRLAVPGRGDEAGHRPHAHERGGHLLRHDGDLAGLDPDRRTTIRSRSGSGSVGRVHPHVEVKIVDPEGGATVARGEPGELCTRGYSVMAGYWNDPERTAEAIDADGWMHTGDLATMDDEGYVNIVGRSKDMVIRGGENVYPREVEEFLYGHPDDRRRPGDRRARPALRRGADGLGRSPRAAPRSTPRRSARSARAGSPTTRSRATSRPSTASR